MASWQWFGQLHRAVYRATGGRIGGRLAGLDMLLLTTTGRRTGQARTTPMPFYREGERLVIVGSNGGADVDPAWWKNLQACPEAEVEIGRERLAVRAALATPEERARLWPALQAWNPNYRRYEKKTSRIIPVVVLTPFTPQRSPS
jgi:deazaflavin-dependent oxidoreductase (nitroreductase family)